MAHHCQQSVVNRSGIFRVSYDDGLLRVAAGLGHIYHKGQLVTGIMPGRFLPVHRYLRGCCRSHYLDSELAVGRHVGIGTLAGTNLHGEHVALALRRELGRSEVLFVILVVAVVLIHAEAAFLPRVNGNADGIIVAPKVLDVIVKRKYAACFHVKGILV